MFFFFIFFFFQAEDGIRDLVRSRGLGDVYKRQDLDTAKQKQSWFSGVVMAVRLDADIEDLFGFEGLSSSRIQVQTTAPI